MPWPNGPHDTGPAQKLKTLSPYKCSRTAAFWYALIWIVCFPVWLVVVILYEAHVILSSRKLGVSMTALGPMTTRWLQHQLGLRRDEACAKLIKVLPNHCYAGLYAMAFPVSLGHRLTGFVPKMLRYPYEGIPAVRHQTAVRSTFGDAAIEKYLPGVEQVVELGAGYNTRTVQLQHYQRIRCLVSLPEYDRPPGRIRSLDVHPEKHGEDNTCDWAGRGLRKQYGT